MIDNDKTVFLWTYDVIDLVYSIALCIYFNAWKCHYCNHPASPSSSLTSYHFRCLCSNTVQFSYTAHNGIVDWHVKFWIIMIHSILILSGDVKIASSKIKTRIWSNTLPGLQFVAFTSTHWILVSFTFGSCAPQTKFVRRRLWMRQNWIWKNEKKKIQPHSIFQFHIWN